MGNSLLAVRGINHKYIVVEERKSRRERVMNIFDLRDTVWFHLDKEYPVQEVYIEIRHLEHIEKNSGKRESSCCIVLPECEAEELKTARGPLVIGKGLGGLIYVYLIFIVYHNVPNKYKIYLKYI